MSRLARPIAAGVVALTLLATSCSAPDSSDGADGSGDQTAGADQTPSEPAEPAEPRDPVDVLQTYITELADGDPSACDLETFSYTERSNAALVSSSGRE